MTLFIFVSILYRSARRKSMSILKILSQSQLLVHSLTKRKKRRRLHPQFQLLTSRNTLKTILNKCRRSLVQKLLLSQHLLSGMILTFQITTVWPGSWGAYKVLSKLLVPNQAHKEVCSQWLISPSQTFSQSLKCKLMI